MKGKNFEIKISDLLNHLGSDRIEFSEMKTPLLPNLTEEGMSGILELHSVDGKSVLVSLLDFEATLHEECEICGKEFIRPIYVEEYVAKFALDVKELEESDEEVLFLIDAKKGTINVEEMLYQAVKLQEPFVMKCEECEKKSQTISEDFDGDE
jgi:uncharacterized metal-binding protein YceD (DUF177 family)